MTDKEKLEQVEDFITLQLAMIHSKGFAKQEVDLAATTDQILSKVAVISDEQELPEPLLSYALSEKQRAYYDWGQWDMLQAGFRKLIDIKKGSK